ncbi:MAG: VOC family protein [Lautropia sp.]
MAVPIKPGTPCWYELGTGDLDAAVKFYGQLFGWSIEGAGMPGMDYRLASSGNDRVAGLMSNRDQAGPPPPNWTIYLTVADCDAACAQVTKLGGKVHVPATEIPNTGHFAVLADPQGAVFGVLTPLPMDGQESQGGAFNQRAAGHGAWHELMTTRPEQALTFYASLFGWRPSSTVDMGAMGTYQIFSHDGADIGGMMGLGNAPHPAWLPYFGVDDVQKTIDTIRQTGGTLVHGPMEVPGPALIAVALDPQQAAFAVVGPKP